MILLAAAALPACSQNQYALNGQSPQAKQLQEQQLAAAARSQELQSRASTLDQDNEELATLLAQSRQEVRVLDEQLTAVRDQLRGTTTELARLRDESSSYQQQAQTLAASVKQRVAASITPNSSLSRDLPNLNIQGVEVRRDGEVVRVEVSSTRLFDPGGARLSAQAGRVLDDISVEVRRLYPDQIVGIEGHTDPDPILANGWSSRHQLSVGQAMAVYDYLSTHNKFSAQQLFVAGHGANHPVVSNATPAGRERNRRIELVVYPERPGSM